MRALLCKSPLGFVIGRKSIEERFDVNYYKPEYRELIKKLENSPFEIKRLGDVVSLSSERWKRPKSGIFRYIEINDIDTFSAQIIKAKELNVEDAPSRAQMVVRKDDIIVSTTRPYRGAIALVTEEYDGCICSTGFAVIRKVDKRTNRKYLLHILHSNIGLKQMEQRMTGGNYPAITPDELLKIWVPIPPLEIQNKVVKIIDNALKQKEEGDKEVSNFLRSVENYMLKKLGIKMPKIIEEDIFIINAQNLKEERFNPSFHRPMFRKLIDSIIKSKKYPCKKLGEVGNLVHRPFKPVPNQVYKYIELGDIDRDLGEIKEYREIQLPDIPSRAQQVVQSGEIIIAISEPKMGAFAVVKDEHNNWVCSSGFAIFRTNHTLNQDYAHAFLRTTICRQLMDKYATGAGLYRAISKKDLLKVIIPVPPLEIQNEIALEINSMKRKVIELQKKGKQTVEKAKKEIEKIILGEKL